MTPPNVVPPAHRQAKYQVRFDWGVAGLAAVAQDADVVVWVAALPDPVTVPLLAAVRSAMPVRDVSEDEARELGFGRPIPPAGLDGVYAAVADGAGVVALLRDEGDRARPVLVFQAS